MAGDNEAKSIQNILIIYTLNFLMWHSKQQFQHVQS